MRLSSGTPATRFLSIPARGWTRCAQLLTGAFALAALGAPPARAQVSISVHADTPDSAWIVDRLPLDASRTVLQNRSRGVAILLMDSTLVFQFTDRGLDDMDHDIKNAPAQGVGTRILAHVLAAGLTGLFDHGVAYRLDAIGSAHADGHRLVLVDRAGKRLFDSMEVNGRQVMDDFPSGSALVFAARVNDAIRRRR